jgi:hypothetical protein
MNARRRENEDWRRELVVLKTVAQVGCRVVCVGGKEDAVKWAARPGDGQRSRKSMPLLVKIEC